MSELIVEDDLPEQLRIRREKRAAILSRGQEPYPVAVPRTASLKEIRTRHADLEIDVATGIQESLSGRICIFLASAICEAIVRFQIRS